MMHLDWIYKIRKVSRKLGLNKLIMSIIGSKKYENAFGSELLATISQGDIVWDVGANVGYYTQLIATKVDRSGQVIAFEPFSNNFQKLSERTRDLENVSCYELALGLKNSSGFGVLGTDELGATNSVTNDKKSDDSVPIKIFTGDDLIGDGIHQPDVIKIDVEGAELDVLKGLSNYLETANRLFIFVEVHFEQLDKRGYKNGAKQLVALLKKFGYEVQWIDRSHIKAEKL